MKAENLHSLDDGEMDVWSVIEVLTEGVDLYSLLGIYFLSVGNENKELQKR